MKKSWVVFKNNLLTPAFKTEELMFKAADNIGHERIIKAFS